MEIKEIEIELIKPYELNAKKHDKTQISNVAESIREFGWQQPIVLDKENVIIIGHCRFEAAKLLNLDKVPVTYANDLTEEQVKKLRLIDNKTNESEWDLDLVMNELQDLDLSAFDFDWDFPKEIEDTEVTEDDFDIDSNFEDEVDIHQGDIFQLGNHRLMCGDSTSKEDVDKLVRGGQLIF